jgi:hypothetical protein
VLVAGGKKDPNGNTRADRFVNGLAGDPELVCGFGYRVAGLLFGGHKLYFMSSAIAGRGRPAVRCLSML